jgi:DNA-binding NtrC family response regulator
MSPIRHKRPNYAAATGGRSARAGDSAPLAAPTVVVFSADKELTALAQRAAPEPWKVENCEDPAIGREALSRPNVKLVIVDDEVVREDARGWLLDRIHRFVPQALLIYVAASHSPADEKRARSYAAQYYTAKPIDAERTLRVVQSFLKAAAERDGNLRTLDGQ